MIEYLLIIGGEQERNQWRGCKVESKMRVFKVGCTKPDCTNTFYMFRADDKHPASNIKCLDCETNERISHIQIRNIRSRNGSNVRVTVGVDELADRELRRAE
jgi:hypothetical protein